MELLIEEVYVPEEVEVLVEEAEYDTNPEADSVLEAEDELVADTVGKGLRLRVPDTVLQIVGRLVVLAHDDAEAVRVSREEIV